MFDPKSHLIQLPRKVKDRQTGHWTIVHEDYLEVKWRVLMFREKYPHGRLTTEEIQVDLERQYARFRCVVEDGQGGQATGYGTETAADFADYVERAETRAIGRALALLGFGTQFVGQDLTEGEHVADAPVAQGHGSLVTVHSDDGHSAANTSAQSEVTPEGRITRDQARELKKAAQAAFGFSAGEQQVREDLGLEDGKALTLMRLQAHVSPARYEALMADYQVALRQEMEQDVPDHAPVPAAAPVEAPTNGQPAAEPPAEERLRWGALSRKAMQAGLPPATWEALRAGDYAVAERMIAALAPTNGQP